jgi:hypothetical protein
MKTIRFLCVVVICVPMAFASPTCVSGTLADYVALGALGCGFDGLTFSSFQYVASSLNAMAPLASSITVAPDAGFLYGVNVLRDGTTSLENLYAVGFDFGVNVGLGRIPDLSRTLEMHILYRAASSAGIGEAVAFAGVGGDELSTGTSTTFISGLVCTYVDSNGASSTGRSFSPTNSVSVDHRIYLSVGPAYPGVGGAAVEGLKSGFVTTPEPAGLLPCCAALLVLAGLAWTRRTAKG